MSLYQVYRPKTFADMVGNTEVINAIQTHFAQDPKRVSHCHIIYGSSGAGKTTIARIIATELLHADPDSAFTKSIRPTTVALIPSVTLGTKCVPCPLKAGPWSISLTKPTV